VSSVLLVDLSSIVHRHWHATTNDVNPDATSEASLRQVHGLASAHDHVAICCDSGKSFRAEEVPSYKANRPKERNEPLYHQMTLTREALVRDGFPVWAVPGFEADDLIASATRAVLANDETTTVLIASADKDLLALVNDRVSVKSVQTGNVADVAAVREKFGVAPEQMTDYLTMVGDSSDNIAGIRGVGPKRAVELLTKFGSLDELYVDFNQATPTKYRDLGFTPALVSALEEFAPRLDETRRLVLLRDDVALPIADLWKPREAAPSTDGFEAGGFEAPTDEEEEIMQQVLEAADAATTDPTPDSPTPEAAPEAPTEPKNITPAALVVRQPDAPAPAKYELQLDPRSPEGAYKLSVHLAKSRMFTGYGSPEQVLSTVMAGRELGLPAISSLRGIHNIEGKHALSAQLMVALILQRGVCEFFERVSSSDVEATYEAKRKGAKNPQRVTYTIEQAQRAGLVKPRSNWEKDPESMLIARASSRLARIVAPDICGGLMTPDEVYEGLDTAQGVA